MTDSRRRRSASTDVRGHALELVIVQRRQAGEDRPGVGRHGERRGIQPANGATCSMPGVFRMMSVAA